ncbi:MAG: long-chain fatty acid--CoA ligase [Actinomycetota bacterium]|nr:long-chain fatty acid--CoA ligase [Actinomycetota bacterium]
MPTLSVASILSDSAKRRPDKVAIVQGERRVTYAQLWDSSLRVAGALAERGVGPGSRVALFAPNVIEFVSGYYGVIAAGATAVMISPLLTPAEGGEMVRRSGADLVLSHESVGQLAAAIAQQGGASAILVSELATYPDPLPTYVTRAPDDIAVLIFTSGTTGRPKAVMLSHLNLIMTVLNMAYDSDTPASSQDVVMGCLPLFHIFGQQASMNTPLRVGATMVLMPRFDAAACLRSFNDEGVTVFAGVPTMFVQLLQAAARPGAPGIPLMKRVASGGAALPVAVLEQVEATFGAQITEGYGLSETSPGATSNQQVYGVRPGTVGHPSWGVEVEIADSAIEDRVELIPVGERGEVVVRGHCVFEGYLDDPEATAAAIQDGWFRTGDIGVKDADGFLSIVDRKKDLIIRGGFNIYPREVEEVLVTHPDVQMAAVVGVPDAEYGEEIVAFVTLIAGSVSTADDIQLFAREHLARYKYPRTVHVREDLPLGPSMKILRRELRRQAGADS